MLRRWLALLVLAGVVFVGASLVIAAWLSHPRVRPVAQPGPLLVVSMPTLTWSDISRAKTPQLWSLAESGAVGAQATRTPTGRSCSVQSWLTFSASTPTDAGPDGRCAHAVAPNTYPDGSATFLDWNNWHREALGEGTGSVIGKVGSLMIAGGQCVNTAGKDAALGGADTFGILYHYTADPENADLSTCPVTLISFEAPDDAALGRLLARMPVDTTVVVTGMADDRITSPTLHAVIVAGPGVPHGLLTSLSTRQPGVLQTADLSALVLARLGHAAPIIGLGREPVVRPVSDAGGPVAAVTGLTRALDVEYPFVPLFFTLFLGGSAIAGGLGLLWWWLDRRRRAARVGMDGLTPGLSPPLRWWLALVAAMCAAMPAATLLAGLVPWWNAAHPELMLSLTIVGISAVITALALLGPWRRRTTGPIAFMVGVTFFVIAQDVMHGSRLQFISLMGLQPVYGGRYYGQGNVAYAVFATTALLIATFVAGRMIAVGQRRTGTLAVVLVGLTALVIDGSPSWGADGGGPVAMIPAFGYLALKAAGEHITWRRILWLVGATVGLVGAFALFDYLGPAAYRTHLGDAVAQVLSLSPWKSLGPIWTQNWTMLTSNWFTRCVPLLILASILVAFKPDSYGRPLQPVVARAPFLRNGLKAVVICWVLAFLSNDSGTGIPPTGLLIVAPLLLLLAVSHRPATADSPARTPQLSGDAPAPPSSRHVAAVLRRRTAGSISARVEGPAAD